MNWKRYVVEPLLWTATLIVTFLVGGLSPVCMFVPAMVYMFAGHAAIYDVVSDKDTFIVTKIIAVLHVPVLFLGIYVALEIVQR